MHKKLLVTGINILTLAKALGSHTQDSYYIQGKQDS